MFRANSTRLQVAFSHLKLVTIWIRNRNRKLLISSAPTKAKSQEPSYSQALTKTKSIGSGQNPESQASRQSDGYGGWCVELRRGGRYGDDDDLVAFFVKGRLQVTVL